MPAITYFDSSALVPLVIAEPTTARCNGIWDQADAMVTTTLSFVEVHAAIAQAARQGRLGEAEHRRALAAFEARWGDMVHVTPGDAILANAAHLAAAHALRGYDAIQCATALAVASDDFIAVGGDRDLLRAWSDLGVATVDVGG
ncbi:type II toxin-antitoxin system VapC family toxin [Microbacterium sp.]|uniref:type II toxin-antitoxin system VapC family toxin n=1 Tax=Microbacterium sp. TaxID=51671 RepID=UPI0039E65D55